MITSDTCTVLSCLNLQAPTGEPHKCFRLQISLAHVKVNQMIGDYLRMTVHNSNEDSSRTVVLNGTDVDLDPADIIQEKDYSVASTVSCDRYNTYYNNNIFLRQRWRLFSKVIGTFRPFSSVTYRE